MKAAIESGRKSSRKKENEYIDQLNRIRHENRSLSCFPYFTDVMFNWYVDYFDHRREFPVVVLGSGVPVQIVLSFGIRPLFLMGGSHDACAFSEELVPRDTDPVSRSILGFLNSPDAPDFSETLFLVPLVSDSMRKTAYILKEQGKKVFPLDIPPVRGSAFSPEKWERQMELLTSELEEHLGRALKSSTLRKNIRLVSKARGCLYDFLKIASDHEDLIPGSARILIQNSFYCAGNLEEWCASLKKLIMELLSLGGKKPSVPDLRPRILLMGSPVFFPGFKIPYLLEDVGLRVWRNLDAYTAAFQEPLRIGGFSGIRNPHRREAASWYYSDASSAYTSNSRLRGLAANLAESGAVDGVVFHVLKGQVEPDFELTYFEDYFADMGIPTFRLETDYQYQDIEQLRIRMEAFREMLVQRRLSGAASAKVYSA